MTEIEIIDVTPRDGLQNEPVVLSTDNKVRLINRLLDTGVVRIEAASFVHPRRVPAMADADEVMWQVPRDRGASYIGLALNRRGIDRALAADVDEINYVVPVTDAFAERNQGSTVDGLIDDLREATDELKRARVGVSVTLAVAFGCPYSGRVGREQVQEVVRKIGEAAQLDELALADTIGCAVPSQVRAVTADTLERVSVPMRLHLHETRHTAIANALAAIELGVSRFDSSVAGLGGCPFAPGAVGNVSTEDLAWALREEGHATPIDIGRAIETGQWVSDLVNVAPRSGLNKAGAFPESAMRGNETDRT